ncbi:hypothetical protein Tco_1225585 [Tanacetum coccineum]
MDRFCDYHQEKGHHTNDCHQLKRQLEAALESGKPNHLIRDVHQRGRGNQRGDGPQQEKIINMIRTKPLKEKKRKAQEVTEEWMNTPITFPLVSTEDVLDEPLIVEAEVEGYLARLKETQTDLVGFAGEATKPLGKIEFEDRPKNLEGHSAHYLFNDEIPHSEGNCHFGHLISGGLPESCKAQLKFLLKDNMDIFTWEPSDMMGVPRRVMEHNLNVNTSIEPERQKRRVLAPKKVKR